MSVIYDVNSLLGSHHHLAVALCAMSRGNLESRLPPDRKQIDMPVTPRFRREKGLSRKDRRVSQASVLLNSHMQHVHQQLMVEGKEGVGIEGPDYDTKVGSPCREHPPLCTTTEKHPWSPCK